MHKRLIQAGMAGAGMLIWGLLVPMLQAQYPELFASRAMMLFVVLVILALIFPGLLSVFTGLSRLADRWFRRSAMALGFVLIVGGITGVGVAWGGYAMYRRGAVRADLSGRTEFKKHLSIIFKDSPLLTPEVRRFQSDAIGDYLFYLHNLGIDTPTTISPIGVTVGGTSGSGGPIGPAPDYAGDIWIGDKFLQDRKVILNEVGIHVFTSMLEKSKIANNLFYPTSAAQELNGYLHFSFLGEKRPNEGGGFIDALWEIRSRHGQPFGDSLAAFTFQVILDEQRDIKPAEPGDEIVVEFNRYFYARLLDAEYIVDNYDAKLEQIRLIVKNSGIRFEPTRR